MTDIWKSFTAYKDVLPTSAYFSAAIPTHNGEPNNKINLVGYTRTTRFECVMPSIIWAHSVPCTEPLDLSWLHRIGVIPIMSSAIVSLIRIVSFAFNSALLAAKRRESEGDEEMRARKDLSD
ncbi:unnamed protein product [Ixodes pacificus]